MRKVLTLIILYSFTIFQVQCQSKPPVFFDREVIKEAIMASDDFKPVPQAKETFWRQTIPKNMRESYIILGHSYKDKSWNIIPDSVFAEFRTTGNRSNYERLSFGIRRQFASLVMGEIMEHQGLLIDDILKGLDYFIEEIWWGVSAHYPTSKPDTNNQIVDLFNSETANLLAWTVYMLHDELESARPGICEIIKQEINRRFLTPVREVKDSWYGNVGNHNTWTCANWLSCILLCEDDWEQQIRDINRVLTSLEYFIDGYPNDGGCDEGVGYWDRAAASLYECIRLLEIVANGKLSYAENVKLKAMGSFVYKTYISKDAQINFADTHAKTRVNINILYPYGHYIKDTIMTRYAAWIAEEVGYKKNPSATFLYSGNYPALSRELFFLHAFESFDKCQPYEPLLRDVWLPDLQVFSARSFEQSIRGLYIAAKGGHNAEAHNHNDVGSFIVYCDGNPMLIDLGFATYTAKTFGDKRYELTNCRSAYHNVPLINGFEQHVGKHHCAKEVNYRQNIKGAVFSLNIGEAYPKEAEIENWWRNIKYNRKRNIVITEEYELKKFIKPSEIVLITCGETKLNKNGEITIGITSGTRKVIYNANQLSPIIETLQIDDIEDWRNKPLYRIRLVIKNSQLKGKVSYTIK